ncbi:MAG: flagellar assembly protein FliW, partial [bacterium]
ISEDYVQDVLTETAGGSEEAEPLIYVLVSVDEENAEVRVNLQAPIIMRTEEKTAEQTVLTKGNYPVAYVLQKPLKEGV